MKHRKNIGIYAFFVFVLVVFCLLLFTSRCRAEGQIEIGMSYNSNTKREKNNFLAKIQEKKEDLEIEIYSNFLKEQENEVLESLRIDSEIQLNYYSSPNIFYFSKAGYNRDIEQGILDKTSIDLGAGYKDYSYKYPYRIQAGLSSQSICYDQSDLERDIYSNISGDIAIPYEFLEFKNDVDFLVNTKAIEGTDIEISNVVSVIANLSEDFFLSFSLNYSYLNHPPKTFPKEIKIYMLRAGVNF